MKSRPFSKCLAIAWVLLGLAAGCGDGEKQAPDVLTFGSPQQINDTLSSANYVEVFLLGAADWLSVRNGSLQIDATWMGANGIFGNIFYSQNLDLLGFSPEVNLIPDGARHYIPGSIETDSQMNPGIFYYHFPSSQAYFLKSNNQGQSFNAPVPIFDPLPAGHELKGIVGRIDAEDGLHAVFTMQDTTLATNPINVFYAQSTDGGMTWSQPKQVSQALDSNTPQVLPHLAVGPSGNEVYVCWQDQDFNDVPDIFFSLSADGGVSFSAPKPITTAGDFNSCRLARGPKGEVYLSYSELDPVADAGNVFLVKSTDGGATFGAPTPVNAQLVRGNIILPMLSVDNLGRIDVVWSADSDDSGDLDVLRYARSLDNGASFSPDITIASGPSGDNNTGSILLPSGLRHDGSGRLFVQYAQAAFGDDTLNIYFLLGQ